MNNNKVSLVILSFNLKNDLEILLNYLLLSDEFNDDLIEVIVVDNNSTDGTIDLLLYLKIQYPKLIIKILSENVGAGGGRNIGWNLAKNEIIVSIDHDAWINLSDLKLIPKLFDQFNKAGILAFKIIHPITNDLQNPHGDKTCYVSNFHGAGFAIRKSVFLTTKGMDNEVIYGGDELELSIKVHSCGWDVLYFPDIIVFHNSRSHDQKEEIFRDKGYLYGNIKLLYKFFPESIASRNAKRYFILSLFAALKKYGILSIPIFLSTYKIAKKDGIKKKQYISKRTIDFYNNINLRPEFGNVPLYFKVYKLFSKYFK